MGSSKSCLHGNLNARAENRSHAARMLSMLGEPELLHEARLQPNLMTGGGVAAQMFELLGQSNVTKAVFLSKQDQIERVKEVNKLMLNTQISLVTMLDLFAFY